jgi:hypothetical protein
LRLTAAGAIAPDDPGVQDALDRAATDPSDAVRWALLSLLWGDVSARHRLRMERLRLDPLQDIAQAASYWCGQVAEWADKPLPAESPGWHGEDGEPAPEEHPDEGATPEELVEMWLTSPGDMDLGRVIAAELADQAAHRHARGDTVAALRLGRQLLQMFHQFYQLDPEDARHTAGLIHAVSLLSDWLVAGGQLQEAVREVERVMALGEGFASLRARYLDLQNRLTDAH